MSLPNEYSPLSRSNSTMAIPIPDADLEYEVDELGSEEVGLLGAQVVQQTETGYASPGAGSYVAGNESWRPVPPPQLASSLEPRYQPKFHTQPSRQPASSLSNWPTRHIGARSSSAAPTPASYGSLGSSTAIASQMTHGREDEFPHPTVASQTSATMPTVPAAVLQMSRRARRALSSKNAPSSSAPSSVREKLNRAMAQAKMLGEAPRELWLIFVLKFLSSFAYFSLSLILTMYLSDEFGFSDMSAGWAYGTYGVMSTFFGLICGWFIDSLGVRASLLIGAIIGAGSRFVFALTGSPQVAVVMLYTLLPFAECLGIPIMTIGIKRYTNARNRTFAFSLFYAQMNLAALVAGPLCDALRNYFKEGVTVHFRPFFDEVELSGLRLVVLAGSIATAAMSVVVLLGIREIQVDEAGNLSEFTPTRQSPMEQTMSVLREAAFWRLTVFTLLLIGVRMVFRHIDATMPKYLTRQFGPDAPFGLVYAINPFLIIFLVPIVGLLTRKIDSFSMILNGSFVAAASPFWLCIKQSYVSVVLFMVTLSIGEAVYSPRVYEYTMAVSADGQEGLYSSLSAAPLFSVKLIVGGMSGWLLTSFMPANGPHHGNILWGIIGVASMTSPILMCVLRDFISPPGDTAQDSEELPAVSSAQKVSDKPHNDILVTGARPPTGRSSAIPVRSNDFGDGDENDDDDDREALLSSSYHGKSPLSLPPISRADLAAGAGSANASPSRHEDNG